MNIQLPARAYRALICKSTLSIVINLLLLFQVTMAQNNGPVVTYEASNVRASEALKEIEKQTSYTLTFNSDEMNEIVFKKVKWKKASVQQVLNELQKNYGIQSIVTGNNIALKPGTIPESVPRLTTKSAIITGKIIDEENGDPIVSANIKISEVGGTTSGVDGLFTINVPKGRYVVAVSSVGYETKNVTDIEVKENKLFELNVTLKRQKGQLAGVVVTATTARKETVASLYSRQKNNASIGDGISAEQISATPDKNLGESIRRISGVSSVDNKYVVVRGLSERYNQALLNGQAMPSTELNRKQFSFDIIPSNMVDNIVVAKSLTPDMSAEFGGGLVQVETKSIPSENFISLSAGTSINDQTAGENMLTFERDGKKGYWGNYASHRYLYGKKDWNTLDEIRAYKDANKDNAVLTNNWQPYYYKAQPSQNYQLSVGHIFKTGKLADQKLGVLASLSYRNTQTINNLVSQRFGFDSDSTADNYLRGKQYVFATNIGGVFAVGYTTKKHKISWQNLFTELLDEQTNFGKGKHVSLDVDSRALIEKVQQTGLWQSQLKGEHVIGEKGIKINWIGNYTYVKRERPDNHVALWKTVPDSFELPHNDFTVMNFYPELVNSGMLRMYTKAEEKNLSWNVDAQVPFTLSITKNIFKAGYAGWKKDRNFYVALLGDQPAIGATSSYPSLPNLFSPEYGGGKNYISEFGDDYSRTASLHAFYGMFDNRIASKWRLVWGVRAEYFDMNKANQTLDAIIQGIKDSRGSGINNFSALYNREKNWKFFPSANLTYSVTPRINARAAYSKSIIRPDLREMAYFREYDFELGGTYNADLLHSTTLNNYDVRLEWFPGAGEIVSGSFFYKDIKYPMEIYKQASNSVYTLRNNYKSHNYGIEVEVRKSLAFIHVPVIRNLTIYGNFTGLNSKVTPMQETTNRIEGDKVVPEQIIGKEEKRPLMGQSNYVGNAGLYYNDKLLHISISYNAISNRMVVYEQDAIHSQFEKPMRSLDAQIAVRFLKQRAEVKINLSNLLQESSLIYLNRAKTPEEDVRAKEGDYSNKYLLYQGHDLLIQKWSPGRTAGIVLSYTF
jgi:outer membrane receptor protein involved in Fe transport